MNLHNLPVLTVHRRLCRKLIVFLKTGQVFSTLDKFDLNSKTETLKCLPLFFNIWWTFASLSLANNLYYFTDCFCFGE